MCCWIGLDILLQEWVVPELDAAVEGHGCHTGCDVPAYTCTGNFCAGSLGLLQDVARGTDVARSGLGQDGLLQ